MAAFANELNRKHAPVASQKPAPLLPVWIWWLALAAMLGMLTVPILAVEVPPITDYPNHLARSYFLAFGSHDSVMSHMFAVRWALIPNLAIDLLLPPLMHVVPPIIAGQAVVALAVLL